jgi:site-specific DNA-methyltransferase (adenine-specific)
MIEGTAPPSDFRYVDQVICGDAVEVARRLPAGIARSIVTSPPYFRQRDYGYRDQIGSEATPTQYVTRLIETFSALREILTPDGTLWLNLGDVVQKGELLGLPWQVALALKKDGWRLISDVIWHKPNAMPSSTTRRPTVDHEYLFLFAKTLRYHYDADAVREPHKTFSADSRMRGGRAHLRPGGRTPEGGKFSGQQGLHSGSWAKAFHPNGRNRRTVWSVPLSKFRGAHFAVFPERLIDPCISATTVRGDIVLDPFIGSGTTAVVAKKLGRHFIGIDVVEQFCQMAERRVDA